MAEENFTPVLLTLPSFTPSLALEVLPHGLTFHRLIVQADGRTHDILVGPEHPKDHLKQKYTNTIIGRYANRLPTITSTLSKNGISSEFTPRPNEKPEVSLHGGVVGWDSVPWTPLLDPTESTLFTEQELLTLQSEVPTHIIFTRTSEDGEEGYPGRLRVGVLVGLALPQGSNAATQSVDEEYSLGSLVVVYRAALEDGNKVTPINLTQHWGFNLDASVESSDVDGQLTNKTVTVKDHKLDIKASNIIDLSPGTALSSGNLLPVKGTHHAHGEKETRKIGENWPENGYDEFYLFDHTPAIPTRLPASAFPKASLEHQNLASTNIDDINVIAKILAAHDSSFTAPVTLEGEKSGLKLVFDTNQPGEQFYSNNLTSPSKNARKKIHGGSGLLDGGDGYDVGSAAFLEFHAPLAAWLHPSTLGPTADNTILSPGEIYNNFVRLDVLYKSPGTA